MRLPLVGVAWTGSRFVAVGEDGIRFESVDGAAWNASSSRTINDLYFVLSVLPTGGFFAERKLKREAEDAVIASRARREGVVAS